MRNLLGASIVILLAAGCGPTAEESPAVVEPVAAPEAALVTPSRDSCADIGSLAAAMDEPVPFASLRTGKVLLDGREVADAFTSKVAPAGGVCQLGVMEGFTPTSGQLFVANCLVLSSGMLEREANAVKAKAAFDAARNDLEKCLPAGWLQRDGSQPDADSTESIIFESPADAKRSMDASFYAYPVELQKAWVEGGAQTPGWRVSINFQKEGPTP